MTYVRENATLCAECRPLRDAYDKGCRDQWEQGFALIHGRLATDRERLEHRPMGSLGPRGYPGCEKCHGTGAYIDGKPDEPAVLSRTMGMPGTPLHLAATDTSAPASKLQA